MRPEILRHLAAADIDPAALSEALLKLPQDVFAQVLMGLTKKLQ